MTARKTCAVIEPDREQIERFVRAVFEHAPLNSIVTLRSFYDDRIGGAPFQSNFERLRDESDFECVIDTAFKMAVAAVDCPRPVVMCPSLATYAKRTSKAVDLVAGLALTVECDEHALLAEQTLEAILGAPSFTVASGGIWLNPDTGELEDKLHLHWVLKEPALTEEAHGSLRRLRELACDLVGADATSKAIVHPIRWPGTVHRKKESRLSSIIRETSARIDLKLALAELEGLAAMQEGFKEKEEKSPEKSGLQAKDVSSDLLHECAKTIPNNDLDWASWNRIAMAFWGGFIGQRDWGGSICSLVGQIHQR